MSSLRASTSQAAEEAARVVRGIGAELSDPTLHRELGDAGRAAVRMASLAAADVAETVRASGVPEELRLTAGAGKRALQRVASEASDWRRCPCPCPPLIPLGPIGTNAAAVSCSAGRAQGEGIRGRLCVWLPNGPAGIGDG